MSAIRGYPSQQKLERLPIQFVTVEPVHKEQNGASVVAHQFVYEVATDAAEAGSTSGKIVATAHTAMEGDIIGLTSGAQSGKEIKVVSVTADEIWLAEDLPAPIAAATTFKILRHKYPVVEPTGEVKISGSFSTTEEATAADGGALPAKVKVAGGYDGSAVQVLKTDAQGELQIDVLSSALPSGAATSAIQTDGSQKTQIVDGSGNIISSTANALDVNLKSPITVDVSLDDSNDSVLVYGFDGAANRAIKTDANGELQVDVLSSALPTGAATEATLAAVATEATLSTLATEATIGSIDGKIVTCDTGNVTVVASALPTGASTSAAQTDGSQKTQIVDGSGEVCDIKELSVSLSATDKGLVTNSIIHGETTGGGGGYVDVKVTPSGALTVEATLAGLDAAVVGQEAMAASLPVVIASDQTAIPVTDNGSSLTVDGSVSISSSALPTGAATEATLAAVSAQIPASLGQKTMANSLAVVISSDQSSIPVTATVSASYLSVVDVLDANILDTSVTNIPGSASSPVQVIASTAADIKALQLLDTTGAFVGIYVGGIGSEVLKVVMGPGSDQTIEHSIPAASRISLKRLDSTAAVSSGIVAINCLG